MNDIEESCQRAADVLRKASFLIIGAGAGASRDSGLLVYDEVWPYSPMLFL